MAVPSPSSGDDWTQRLRTTLRQRRPRFWRLAAFICLPLLIIGAFLLWLAWPRPPAARLLAVGLDTLVTTEEATALRARLEPLESTEAVPRTDGIEVWFFDADVGRRQETKALTNSQGEATPAWTLADGSQQATFLVRYKGDKYRPGADDLGARLIRWPRDCKILLVDVEETLLEGHGEALRLDDPVVKPPLAAAKALGEAAKDHRLVYLADQPPRALDYRRSRQWVGSLFKVAGFPEGAILGRRAYAEPVSAAAARQALIKDLRNRFSGPLLAIVAKGETAEQLRQQGITCLLLGDAPAAGDITRLKSWDDLPIRLGK